MTGASRQPAGSYEVGYGRPPRHTQFKPGHRLRQAREEPAPDIRALLNKPLAANRNGKRIKIHPHEAAMMALAKAALQGRMRAIKQFLKECDKAGLLKPPEIHHAAVIVIPKEANASVFARLVRTYGPPPWPEDRYAACEAEHARDRAEIDRLHARKNYGQ